MHNFHIILIILEGGGGTVYNTLREFGSYNSVGEFMYNYKSLKISLLLQILII